MPSGKVHAAVSVPIAFALTVASAGASLTVHPVFAGVALGGWLGVLVTPDIDHHWVTNEEHRIARWNKLAGFLWWLYWWPYERIHAHRGASHSWPNGTLWRMVYLCWFLLIASARMGNEGALTLLFWVLVFVGWSVQDCLHIMMDGK